MLNPECIVQYVLSTNRRQSFHSHPLGSALFLPRLNDSFIFNHKGVIRAFRVLDVVIEPFRRAVVVVSPSSVKDAPVMPMLEVDDLSIEYEFDRPVDANTIRRRAKELAPGQESGFNITKIPQLELNTLMGLLDTQGYDTRIVSGFLTVTKLLDE